MLLWQKLQILILLFYVGSCDMAQNSPDTFQSPDFTIPEPVSSSNKRRPDIVLEFMEENGLKVWHLIVALIGLIAICFLLFYPCMHLLKIRSQNNTRHLEEPLLGSKQFGDSFEIIVDAPEINLNDHIEIDLPTFRHFSYFPCAIARRTPLA
ncbi:unnamed protein product [Blepharisma stoltei]|uniref:Uncharacterized protein n=1 Tax=Blepharisma stoltei TaxID=1481888 RepID=A0AAU9K1S4_9CILI|nr:unnamed protein product [Blepharisma stoltei]